MRFYRARETIGFGVGATLKLAREQSEPRLALGALTPISKKKSETVFTVVRPIQFKAGEILGTGDDLPRVMSDKLEEVDADGNPVAAETSDESEGSGEGDGSGEGEGSDEGEGSGESEGSGEGEGSDEGEGSGEGDRLPLGGR